MNLLQDIQRILREDDEEEPKKNLTADGENAIQQVLGRIFSVPSDSTRVVMLLNDADLKDRYLTGKGEAKITAKEATSDEQIAAIFSHANFQVDGDVDPADAFVFVTPQFDLAKIAKPMSAQRPYAVLFNVPKGLAASLTTTNPTDIEDARKVLTEIIAHKNYVATLNVAAIKKAGVGALDDPHEREEQFNVRTFITAYPVRAVIDAARQEQQDKDKNNKLTPGDDDEDGEPKQKAELSKKQKDLVKKIAFAARQLFFAASSHGWPTTPEALKELRDNLVNALSKEPRIADPSWVPFIVKRFYSDIVKSDKNYQNLLQLLAADANFMKLAAGEEPEPDEEGGDEAAPTDGDAAPAATGDTSTADKSAEELANEIKSKGQDYADEVAKILAGKKPSEPAASDEPADATPAAATDGALPTDLPDDVKVQAEKLQKMSKNAINPKTREKAASDLATLLHRHEESKKPKKAKAKK